MSDNLLTRLGNGCNCGKCKLDLCCCAKMEEAKDRIEAQAAEIETMVPRDVAETWKAKAENLSAALKATAASNAEYLKTVVGLKEEIERLRELLAAAYIELSGKDEHASDCATSNAPAMMPGRCDCD